MLQILLLPFGYGQGTGQALNYGGIYENEFGFDGGKSFGLTIAALGFLSASIGGVIYLNVMKKKGKFEEKTSEDGVITAEEIQSDNEIPMQESIDKLTVQIALIAVAYMLSYAIMFGLGLLLPGMKSVIFGFNFLLGVLAATLVKTVMNFLKKKNIIKKEYTNSFLLTRASHFFFDMGLRSRKRILYKFYCFLFTHRIFHSLALRINPYMATISYNCLSCVK